MSNCLDNKPETPYSNEMNAFIHEIPIPMGESMVTMFTGLREAMLSAEYQGRETLPVSETFKLETVHSIITQPNAVAFKVYLGMDEFQKVRMVLVGVDGDGKDIIQRYQENPLGHYPAGEFSIMVEESGQRFP